MNQSGPSTVFTPETVVDIDERWAVRALTDSEVLMLRDFMAQLVERVVVAPRERRGKTFDPSRVGVVWRASVAEPA